MSILVVNHMATFLIALLLFPKSAWAYLDPGTGSHILQMLLVALMGALYGIKVFGAKIKAFLSKVFRRQGRNEDTNGDTQTP